MRAKHYFFFKSLITSKKIINYISRATLLQKIVLCRGNLLSISYLLHVFINITRQFKHSYSVIFLKHTHFSFTVSGKIPKDHNLILISCKEMLLKFQKLKNLHTTFFWKLLYRVNVLKDPEKAHGKLPCRSPSSVIFSYDFIKTRLQHQRFPKCFHFFRGQLFHKTALSDCT